ncbi:MAG TPA: TrmH family RNA methyltransferase [Nitriliruptoraceae bacterium]|nr:TrmH family RNA methyltransferase [Nitriliruptoraceae bacterium]
MSDHDRGTGASHARLQCTSHDCGLRFPVPVEVRMADGCPRCHGSLAEPAAVRTDWPVAARGSTTAQPGPHAATGSGDHDTGSAGHVDMVATSGHEVVALLDNVRSARNVGAMLRTADAMGVAHLHLGGITSPGDHPGVAKTALGAQESVAWSSHPDGVALVAALRSDGWEVWAIEEGVGGEWLGAACADVAARPTRIVVVVGHEVAGIDPAILEIVDRRVAIPMRGTKRSLNVATAFGIATYTLTAT